MLDWHGGRRDRGRAGRGGPATDDLETAWRAIADRFPLVRPQESGPAAVAGLGDDLAALFAELDVPGQLALPADYAHFVGLAGGSRQFGDDWGVYLFDIETALSFTTASCRLFADERPVGTTMWLTIGQSGDRHELALCCDRADPRFGVVYDCDDDHPWHDGGGLAELAASFTAYLASFSSTGSSDDAAAWD